MARLFQLPEMAESDFKPATDLVYVQDKDGHDKKIKVNSLLSPARSEITAEIEAEKTRAEGAESTLGARVDEEKDKRTEADTALDGRIDDLANLDTTAKTDLVSAVNEVRSTATAAYHYKGTVATEADLPADGNEEGDVWNVGKDGGNFAWTGTAWDALGATFDASALQPKELANPITVDGVEKTTVEGALDALNNKVVTVDSALSETSENPVQNKVVKGAVDDLGDAVDGANANANSRLKVVSEMPAEPSAGQVVLYVGEDGEYKRGGIYLYGTEWTLISTAEVDLSDYRKQWNGSKEDWEAMSDAEKDKYESAALDDFAGFELVDAVEEGNGNAVTSGGVYSAIAGTGTITFATAFRTGVTLTTDVCRKIAPNIYFVRLVLNLSSSYSDTDYTLGQFQLGGNMKIDGKSVRGILSGKLYGNAYTDDSASVQITCPITYEVSNVWAFFGKQSGLANVSTSAKLTTKDNATSVLSGVVYMG